MPRSLLTFLVAGLALAAGACSSASSGADRSSSSTLAASLSSLSSPAASSTADPKGAAQAALDAYWAMLKRLYAAPNPDDPELTQRAIDPSLSAIRDLLTTRQTTGEVAQYDSATYHVDTSVSSVDGATASFAGCIVDGGRLVNSATGQVLNDKVTTSRISGTLLNEGGLWKVQRFDVLRKADGEVPCADLA